MDKTEMCQICNIHPLKYMSNGRSTQKYCLTCSKFVRNQQSKMAYQERKKLKQQEIGECIHCKKSFVKATGQQKQCFTKECLDQKKINAEQSRWLNQKERPRQKNSFSCFSYVPN